jgi:predicted phosphate transport protein (TIGR00153 family)
MVRLVPRETKFFDMFAEMANNLTEGAVTLRGLFQNYKDVPNIVQKIKDIEHKGDDMTHAIVIKLNQTFITPFDREDIHQLASALDDVLDFINSAADRLLTYKVTFAPPSATKLADVIVRQSEELSKAVLLLEKNHQRVLEHCVEVNRLENEADTIARDAIGRLFQDEKDPIQLIKVKELLEVLETATDKAEDAANVLETVILKSA